MLKGSTMYKRHIPFLVVLTSAVVFQSSLAQSNRFSQESLVFNNTKNSVFTVFSDEGHGSGFLVDSAGLILTNQHVVSSPPIRVQLDDSTKVEALIIAQDPLSDVAVLQVHPDVVRHLRPLMLAPKRFALAVEGEKVIAIGSPLNQVRIVTSGIVSKVGEYVIISDVNINPGNSGGPLINMDGEVIGINTFVNQSQDAGPGISGIVSIWRSEPLLDRARMLGLSLELPSTARLPVPPREPFPIDALVRAVTQKSKANEGVYNISTDDFQVKITTPPSIYRTLKAHELELAGERLRREEKAGLAQTERYNMFQDLREWAQLSGLFSPVVRFIISPKVSETATSTILNILGGAVAGVAGTGYRGYHVYEFEEDLHDVKLYVNKVPYQEINRSMEYLTLDLAGSNASGSYSASDLAKAGQLVVSHEAFFPSDTAWPHVSLALVGLKNAKYKFVVQIPRETLEQIYLDFEPYMEQKALRDARLVLDQSGGVKDAPFAPFVGMDPKSLVEMKGREPDTVYSVVCGRGAGRPWKASVYKYKEAVDPRFRAVVMEEVNPTARVGQRHRNLPRRMLTDTFVFYDNGNSMTLNHWTLEIDVLSKWPREE
jgi:hypothetical protein